MREHTPRNPVKRSIKIAESYRTIGGAVGLDGKGEEIEWNLRYRKSSRSIIRSTPFLTGRGPIDLILSVFHRVGPHL